MPKLSISRVSSIAMVAIAFAAPAVAQSTGPTAPMPPTQMPSDTMPSPSATSPSMSTPPTSSSAAKGALHDGNSVTLTDDQAKSWIKKSVYSSDNKNLGEVAAFARNASGKVTEMQADIGGFLGIGETRISVSPSQFRLDGDRVVLSLTSDQAKALPKIAK